MGNQNFEKQIHSIIQRMDKQNLSLQSYMSENENIKRKLSATVSAADSQYILLMEPPLKKIAIANGKLLSLQQFQNLKNDNYDVILDYIDRTLFARKKPDRPSKLEKCNCKGIGPHKLKLLRFMFEYPKVPICEETIDRVYGNKACMSPGALTKAIGEVRKALWQAPYIITESDWGESVSHTGSVYLLNDKFKYLVVRYKT